MSEFTILIITSVVISFILYISFTFSQYLSKQNYFLGIFLAENHKEDPQIKAIFKGFKQESFLVFIITTALILLFSYTVSPSYQSFLLIAFLFIQLGLYFVVYIRAHKKVRAFKKALVCDTHTLSKVLVDTTFMEQKNKLRQFFRKLYLIPITCSIILVFYTLYKYPSLPAEIPTHWNYLGEMDAWLPKSIFSVCFSTLLQVCVVFILAFSSDSMFGARSKLNTSQYEMSKENHLNYLRGTGLSLYILTLYIVFLFTCTTFAMLKGTNLGITFTIISLLALIPALLLLFITWFKYRRPNASSEATSDSYSPEDEDDNWLWGSIYNNPNDPSLFVEKRYGMGWTINMGIPKGKIITVLFFLFIVSIIIFSIIASITMS